MAQPNNHSSGFGQWFTDFGLNDGVVTVSPWFTSDNGIGVPAAGLSGVSPVGISPVMFQSSTMPAPARISDPFVASTTNSANLNTGTTGPTVVHDVALDTGVTVVTHATTFTGGVAVATSASDLNALITAADSQTAAGTLTIDISGLLALNTQAAVADGEVQSGNTGAAFTAVPDIAAINLHSGVSLVITGSNSAILDGGSTVRGLFAYAGNVTVNNLTIRNTTAQGGAGASAGFAGGGGAGLGGGLFVGANANVTLNSVSFSGNSAIGGAGGTNLGGAGANWGGGGGLGGNGGIVIGTYFGGGGGVGRTAFGGDGSSDSVLTYGKTNRTSQPGPGIIVGGAAGGNGAPTAYTLGGTPSTNAPHSVGGINGGGGGISEGVNPSGPPFFGGGAGGGGVGGHAGYSYAVLNSVHYDTKEVKGGGGVGGFGGGGGAGYYYGGNGGFGGGGGGGQYKYGGNGGFGGGGGGMANGTTKTRGQGGFGAGNAGGGKGIGNGSSTYLYTGGGAGGGGLGAGGAVFVQFGGVLNFGGAGTVAAGTVTGGAGGSVSETDGNGAGTAGSAGTAFGSGIFIQNNSTTVAQGVTFAPGSGQVLTVSGVIADEKGSGGTLANASAGGLVIKGGGTVKLTGSNTFTGGASISASSNLDLDASGAGGTGTIAFVAGSPGRLTIEGPALTNGTKFSNTVSGFTGGDAIDLSGLTFKAGATANIVSNTLTVISNNVTDTVGFVGAGTNLGLLVVQDAGTGSEIVTTNFTISTEAQLLADLALINSGGADAVSGTGYNFTFLNTVPIVTGGETLNLLSGSSVDYSGTGFTTGGTMTVTAGTLIAGAIGAIGSGALSIGASGIVSVNGFAQTIGDLSGSGSITLGNAKLTEGTTNSTSFSGSISGLGGLVRQNSGTLTLSGANSYVGGLSVNGGMVQLGASGAAEGSTGALTVAASSTLNLAGFNQTIGDLTGAGAITLGTGTLTEGTASSTSFSGIISGGGVLIKQGIGTLTLSGANSYTGGLAINGGMVLLAAANAAGGTTGALAVAAGATLNLNGFAQTIGDLTGAGAITAAAASALTAGAVTSTSFTGVISGATALIKQGTSTLTLSGANSYTGGLSINTGAVKLGASGAAEGVTGALTVGASATLLLNNFNQTVGDLTGSGTIGLGTGTLTEGTANSTSFTGTIVGTGTAALIKQGIGTLTLAGADTMPGGLTINAGGVVLGSAGAAGGAGTITFGAGTGDVLEFHANTVPTNTVAGFVKGQTLDVNMAGTTVTGATIVNTNTLQIALSSGGPLDLTLSPAQTWTGVNFGHTTSGSDNFITELAAAPTVVAGASATFTGGGAAVLADPGLTVSDPSGATLASATVSIGGGFETGDTLTVGTPGALSPSFSNGTLTLTGSASLTTYQTALDSIKFGVTPSNLDPTGGGGDTSRTIDWLVNDSVQNSALVTSTVTAVHVAPTVVAGATATFNGGGAAVALDPGLTVTDVDSGNVLSSATVTIAGAITGDTLNFTNNPSTEGNIAVASDGNGVLVLNSTSSSATVAQWAAALESVNYSFAPSNGDPTGGGLHASRTIDWTVNDGVANSGTATSTINTVHVAPTVVAGATASYTGGDPAVALDPGLTVTDVDSGNVLSSATVTVAGAIIGDTLNFTNNPSTEGNIAVASDSNGVLVLNSTSSTATVAQWAAALKSVTYSFSGSDPTNGGGDPSHTIDWSVFDGVANSSTVTSTLNVAAAVLAPAVTEALFSDTGASSLDNVTSDDKLTGGGIPGAVVTFTEGVNMLGTATAGGSGLWTFTPNLADGPHTVVASETNGGGTGSATLTFTLDTTPPAVTESLFSDTGPSSSDKTTSNDKLTGGGDAGAVVTFTEGVTNLGTATADGSGLWSFTPALADGSNIVVASETDLAGNTGSATLAFTLDTTPPVVSERLFSDTGTSGSDNVTSNDKLTGGGDAGAVVTFTEGVTNLGTATADGSGLWTFTPALSDGAHTVVASETDLAGNTGSATLAFTLDTTPPAVTEALFSDTGPSSSDNVTSNDKLTGGGDAGAVVTFKEGVTNLGTATANGSGAWTFTPTLSDGPHTIVASETDAAGNTGSASLAFTLDTTPPSVTAIDTVDSNPNTGGTEDFTVDFSEPVTGVTTSAFTLADTGSVTGTISAVSAGSGSSITVTVTGASGNGTMGLDLNSSGTGITDTAGTPIAGGFTGGETYTITPAVTTATFNARVYVDANGDGSQDGGETGLSGVTVNLLDGSGNPTGASATTDSGGNVSFTGLAPGSYEVGVITPGGDAVSQATNTNTPNTLAAGDTANATEGVYVPATFSAHVYDDANADGSQDAGDSNFSGITVNLLDGSGNPTGTSTTTDSNGNAAFSGLAPGRYEVAVVTPAGDAVTQTTNVNTPNTLASGGSASATEGMFAPPALAQAILQLTVAEGQSLGNIWSELIANGIDPNPASLTITAVGTTGTHGGVTLNSGTQSLVYVASGLNPSNPVDVFTYTLHDGSGGMVTGTVDVTVTGPNLPTTVDTTPGSTVSLTGGGQRLISQGSGQTLIGSGAGGDELFGGGDTTVVGAGSGNTIFVTPGNHSIAMGANNNTVTLYDGNNTVSATGTGNTVIGGNGNNHISGMTGGSTITLGNGNDSISITGANNTITVGTGTDTISAGTGGNETVTAGDGANTISGGGANDSFTVGNGASKITATGANATINGGNGGDTVLGTAAGDKITTGNGNDSIQVTAGSATIKAGLGADTIKFAGSGNTIVNQGGTDTLTDTGTNNTITLPLSGQGLDTINGAVLTNGDTFDLRAALAGTTWDQQASDIGNYLKMGTSGSNALVELSVTSGGTPITVGVLNGAGSVSLSSFLTHSLLT